MGNANGSALGVGAQCAMAVVPTVVRLKRMMCSEKSHCKQTIIKFFSFVRKFLEVRNLLSRRFCEKLCHCKLKFTSQRKKGRLSSALKFCIFSSNYFLPKYLSRRPANALPWRASSREKRLLNITKNLQNKDFLTQHKKFNIELSIKTPAVLSFQIAQQQRKRIHIINLCIILLRQSRRF